MPVFTKPLVVGLTHSKEIPGQKRVEERARVLSHLSRLPSGSKMGVELSPENLAWIKNNPPTGIEDTLVFAARTALTKGLEVVPLDTEKRMEKHREIIRLMRKRMDELSSQWRSGKVTPKIFSDYKKARRNFVIHRYSRSLGMGLAIRQRAPALNFMGDAQDLNLAMGDSREFEFSEFSEKYSDEAEVFSKPENAGLKEKLVKLLVKRLKSSS